MSDSMKLTKLLDAETSMMSAHDTMLIRKGAALALMVVMDEWKDVYSWLDNSRPDLIACSRTVR